MNDGLNTMAVYLALLFVNMVWADTMDQLCPPAFPNFEKIFERALQRTELRDMFLRMKDEMFVPYNCSCDSRIKESYSLYYVNYDRCNSNTPYYGERECPVTTTVPTTTQPPTTTTEEPTTTTNMPTSTTQVDTTTTVSSTVPPSTGRATSTARQTSTFRATLTSLRRADFESSTTLQVLLSSSTALPPNLTGAGNHPLPRTPPVTSPRLSSPTTNSPPTSTQASSYLFNTSITIKPVVVQGKNAVEMTSLDATKTIIIIAVTVSVAVVIMVVMIVVCRKMGSGVSGLGREKARRQRSDCQPIRSLSRQDTCSSDGTPSIGTLNSAYNPDERHWYLAESAAGTPVSTVGRAGGRLLPLQQSVDLTDEPFHYNTLRTVGDDHAICLGGFGESSSDMTMRKKSQKHNSRKKLNGTLPKNAQGTLQRQKNGSVKHDHIETQFSNEHFDDPRMNPTKYSTFNKDPRLFDKSLEKDANDNITNDNSDDITNETEDASLYVASPHVKDLALIFDKPNVLNDKSKSQNISAEQQKYANENGGIAEKVGDKAKTPNTDVIVDDVKPGDNLITPANAHFFNYKNKSDMLIEPPPAFQDGGENNVAVVQPMIISENPAPKQNLFRKQSESKNKPVNPVLPLQLNDRELLHVSVPSPPPLSKDLEDDKFSTLPLKKTKDTNVINGWSTLQQKKPSAHVHPQSRMT